MNTQNSNISKGLLFRLRSAPVALTNVFECLDYMGSGRRWYNLINSACSITHTMPSAFLSGDFAVFRKIRISSLGYNVSLISGPANSFELFINPSGLLVAIKEGGSELTSATTALAQGVETVVGYVKAGTVGTYYIDGVAAGTCTDNNTYSVATTYLSRGSDNFILSDYMARAFNFAPSSSDISYYSKPGSPIKFIHRGSGASKCLVNFNAEGIGSSWTDKTNTRTATITGAELIIPNTSDFGAYSFQDSSLMEFTSADSLSGDVSIVIQYLALKNVEYLLFSNTKLKVYVSPYMVSVTSDDNTRVHSELISQGDYMIILRYANGTTRFVSRNNKYQASQNSGSPSAGGNFNVGCNQFYGLVNDILIYDYIINEDLIDLIKEIIPIPISEDRTVGLAMRKTESNYIRFAANGTLIFIN